MDKYKVARAVQWLKNIGLGDNSNPLAPRFIEYGKSSADKYKSRLNIATGFLESQNVPEGSVPLKIAVSVGLMHMPESVAIFSMVF